VTATQLKSVFADYGPASLLRNRTVVPDGFELEFIDTETPVQGMARMVRDLEFDMVDMSPTTYFAARSLGVPVIALPITMYAEYPHALLWTHKMSNIRQPMDLLGKTIGVRTWLNPATIWLRGMLATEYGVELDSVNWSLTVADTLTAVPIPPNAHRSLTDPKAFKLLEMVQTGEADAVVDALTLQWHHALEQKRVDPALAQPLFPDSPQYTAALHRYFGYIPIMHLVVVKAAMLEQNPTAARALFEAFGQAKKLYLEGLRSGNGAGPSEREAWLVARDRDNRELLDVGIDPLPMGDDVIGVLDTLMGMMVKYGYIPQPLDIRAQFAQVR
jgi:4,5-dihydroxyphthalate decarboxylase